MTTTCPVCGLCEETTALRCERASKVWLLSPFRFRPESLATTQFGGSWTSMGSNTSGRNQKELLGLFVFVCWSSIYGRRGMTTRSALGSRRFSDK